ncbi:MAG: HAD family hydrolase [Candidatus Bathyarchaeia archaeon]
MVNVVSFDVCGTLINSYYLDYIWNEILPELFAKKKGLRLEEAKNYVFGEYDRIGNKDLRWYLPEFWFKHFNLNEDPIEIFKAYTDKVRFFPEVSSVIKRLSQKYDLIIASGIPAKYAEITIVKIRHFFKNIFSPVSDLQKVNKTIEFYQMICNDLKIEPSKLAHIGDEWIFDFIIPRKVGIKSFFLDRTGERRGRYIIKDLEEFEGRLSQMESKSTHANEIDDESIYNN